jgi:hypothetical protein
MQLSHYGNLAQKNLQQVSIANLAILLKKKKKSKLTLPFPEWDLLEKNGQSTTGAPERIFYIWGSLRTHGAKEVKMWVWSQKPLPLAVQPTIQPL